MVMRKSKNDKETNHLKTLKKKTMKRKYTSLLLACLMLSAQAWAELTTTTIDENTYYQIGTAQDLADFAALVNGGEYNANAILTADIDFAGTGVTMTPIGKDADGQRYNGTFDGQGHYISNLVMENTTAKPYGLFLSIWKAKLKNFYLDNTCSINGGGDVGLVGSIRGASTGDAVFENVANAGNVTSNTISKNDGGNVGGLVGGIWRKATFNNCWTSGTITAPDTPNKNAGAFCGWVNTAEKATFNDCWSSATLPRYTSGTYLSRRSKAEQVEFNHCYAKSGSQIAAENNWCIIDDGKELVWFSKFVNFGGTSAKAKLNEDIDMNELTIQPIGSDAKRYVGTFDGQGHKIRNLVMSGGGNFGLFTTGAEVYLKDFYLDETCSITGSAANVGVIGYHNGKNATFEKIGNAGRIISTGGGNAGGLIGNSWCDNGTVTLNQCWTIGTINSSGDSKTYNNCGVFCGWLNKGTVNFTDCWSTATMNHWQGYDYYFTRYHQTDVTLNFNNCYSLIGSQVQGIVADDVTSGRLCFLLNKGNTTSPTWYQTIGEDAVPTLNSEHSKVYATYNTDCDGATLRGGTLGYANTETTDMTGAATRAHNYSAGVCTQCGQTEANANVYTISTADQFRHFAYGVEAGKRSANATLASDINLADLEQPLPMIGSNGNYYSGTFDGQGHAIHNFSLTSSENYAGLISYLYGGTVKDFSIDGTMNLSGQYAGGIIGQTNSICTVSGIHSTVNITASGSASDHLGGIVGGARGSKTTITNCTYGGTITLPISFNQSAGGIIGGGYNNLNIDNCVFYGTVKATGSGTKTNFGGMIGYLNSTNMNHMKNCISAGTIELAEGRTLNSCNALIASRLKDQTAAIGLTDCYWTDLVLPSVVTKALPDGTTGTSTQITAEKAARGELAWMLNGNKSDGTWTQTLGVQAAPLPISTGDKVYQFATSGENQYFVNDTENPVVPVMTLTDKADYEADGTFTATSLTYDRKLEAGDYHSLCLPFAIKESDLPTGSKLFTLSAVGQDAVTLNEVDEVAAGTPCFASVTSDFNFGTMTDVAMVKDANNSGTIKGTFTNNADLGAGFYKLSSDGKYFGLTTDGATATAFRSYIAAPAGVKTLNILLSDGTSLTPTLSEEKEAVIYDLAGRRVTKATKGIYIVNGKKVMK